MTKANWSLRRFALHGFLIVITMFTVVEWFKANYRIGLDLQSEKCLPGYTVFLVDLHDKSMKKGAIYAFKAKGLEPVFDDGTLIAKRYLAGPGDLVEVLVETVDMDSEHPVYKTPLIKINNKVVREGLYYANRLDMSYESFAGRKTLQVGELWMMGDSPLSFDSRYWGTVKNNQVVGRAYPIL